MSKINSGDSDSEPSQATVLGLTGSRIRELIRERMRKAGWPHSDADVDRLLARIAAPRPDLEPGAVGRFLRSNPDPILPPDQP
jgi:hypothetical protein